MARGRRERGADELRRLERHLEELADKATSKEMMTHFVNAGMEVIHAANRAAEHIDVPEETKVRIHRAEREILLAARSFIDVVLAEVEKELPKQAELKKVEIKRKSK